MAFFFPHTCTESRDGLRCETSAEQQSPEHGQGPAEPIAISRASRGEAGSPELQDKEQKSQGNVTGVVISTHAKVPSAFFFFFPFEISNSSLWTKSCLSENIDLRPLTKLHFKQSRGLLFPLPRTCLLSPWISQDHAENFALEHSAGTCTKRIFALNVSSFLPGKNLRNNQVGALSPATHLAGHCREKTRRRNKGFHCACTSNFSSSFK